MKADVFPKTQNNNPQSFDRTHIPLETPSVVILATGPEQVAQFERVGSDLVLMFKDGTRLVIENFFVETADGRNDLVFEVSHGDTYTSQTVSEVAAPSDWRGIHSLDTLRLQTWIKPDGAPQGSHSRIRVTSYQHRPDT